MSANYPEQLLGICGKVCPLRELAEIGNEDLAREARAWAFSPTESHESVIRRDFSNVGLVAKDLGARCEHNFNIGACKQEPPNFD